MKHNKLTAKQSALLKEAFEFVCDEIDEEGSLPDDLNLDPYSPKDASTLKALHSKGYIKEFSKHPKGYSVTWNSRKVYDWGRLDICGRAVE